MTSTFGWLDHSDKERRRVLDAIDQFKETDTRDELGLATIRDAFADLFFPGTGILQTRVRYFLFIPWLYRALEQKQTTADSLAEKARRAEVRLMDALLASDDPAGTIGKNAGHALKRLPSNIYWLGMRRWNLRSFPATQDDYHRGIDAHYERVRGARQDDDGEPVTGNARSNWNRSMPSPPRDFPERASFRVTPVEARFLAEQIRFSAPGTLLDFLVRRGKDADVAFAWMHPQLAEFPDEVGEHLAHARLFAETMHGAALLYNLMLSEEQQPTPERTERVERYRGLLGDWSRELHARQQAIVSWDRPAFWSLLKGRANVKRATEAFVETWLGLTTWFSPERATDDPTARALVRDRELRLKGPRKRLGNQRALELWTGASGSGRLDYRWWRVKQLVGDIHEGLRSETTDA